MNRAVWGKLFKDNPKIPLCLAGIAIVIAILVAMHPVENHNNLGVPAAASAKVHGIGAGSIDQASPASQAAAAADSTGMGAAASSGLQVSQASNTPPAASTAGGTASAAVGSAAPLESDALYPIDPPPYLCKPLPESGMQPYSVYCPDGCGLRYPCGCYRPGVEIACIAPE